LSFGWIFNGDGYKFTTEHNGGRIFDIKKTLANLTGTCIVTPCCLVVADDLIFLASLFHDQCTVNRVFQHSVTDEVESCRH